MRCYRTEWRWKDPETSAEDKFFVDVFMDEDGHPHPKLKLLGWMTGEGQEMYPFVLTDGQLDFGSTYTEFSERYYTTNLRSKQLNVGQYATFEIEDVEYTYQLVNLTDLAKL